MPESPFLPLIQAAARVDASLCDWTNQQDVIDTMAETLAVDANSLLTALNTGVVFSSTEPTGADFGKLWVKATGTPRGIGLVIDGEYVIIPIPEDADIPDPFPSGGIVIYPDGSVPEGWLSFSTSGMPSLPSGYQYISKQGST